MRHLRFAQHLLANHRDQFVTRQQTVDRPDAGIARLQYVAFDDAHRQPHTACRNLLGLADMGHKKFRYVQFQHSHVSTPCAVRNSLLRLRGWNQRLMESSSKAFCRSVWNLIAARKTSHNRRLVESKSQIDLSGAIDNPCAEQREQSRAYQNSDQHPCRAFVGCARQIPWRLSSQGCAETWPAPMLVPSFSRVRKNPEVLAHSERPALSSVCAGRFVSRGA